MEEVVDRKLMLNPIVLLPNRQAGSRERRAAAASEREVVSTIICGGGVYVWWYVCMYGRFACLYTTTVGKFWRRASVFTQLEIECKVREGFTKFIYRELILFSEYYK